MPKLVLAFNPFTGVSPGQKAIADLTIGPRYHVLWLKITASPKDANTALTISDVCGDIVLKRNSSVFRTHEVTRLNAIQTLWSSGMAMQVVNLTHPGQAVGNGDTVRYYVPIYFCDPSRKSLVAQEANALYTVWKNGSQLRSLSIEVKIPKTGNVLAGSLSYDGYAEYTTDIGLVDASGVPIDNIIQWTEIFQTYSAAGKQTISNLERARILYELHFFTQTGDPITDMVIKNSGVTIRDYDKELNDRILVGREYNASALSADRFDFISDYADVPTDVVDLTNSTEFLVQPTLSAANAANKTIVITRIDYGAMK